MKKILLALLLFSLPASAQVISGGGGKTPTSTCGDSGHALGYDTTTGLYSCQAITGGSAGAGGSNTQVQYNNSGAIDGITGATSNGTSLTVSSGNLKLSGSGSGTAIVNAPATGGGTLTLPAGTDTVAGIAATQTLTNKTISGASNTLTVRAASDISGLGTGVATALGVNVGSAGAPVVLNGAGGTPSSVTLTNGTGLPASGLSATGTQDSSHALFGDNTWKTVSGSGTVTSVATGACLAGGTITTTGTLTGTYLINAQTGTSYTVVAGDACYLVTFSNGSAVAVNLPNATGSFAAGWAFDVFNKGAGTVTITPTTAQINGAATLTLKTNESCSIVSDGTNYQVGPGCPGAAGSTGTGAWARATSPTIASPALSGTVTGNNTVPLAILAQAAANTMPGNWSGSTANEVANTMPSCADSGGNHLNYVNGTGVTCGTSGGTTGGGIPQSTEANVSIPSPSATTIANLKVSISADPGSGQTMAITLRKGGSDQILTCTITGTGGGAATTCSDTTHSVNIAQGDIISWKLVTTGTYVATPTVTISANNGTSNVGVTSVTCNSGLTGGAITTTGTCALDVANANTWTGVQGFNSGKLALNGSTSGVTTVNANATSGTVTATLPANTGIIAELNLNQNFTAEQDNCITTLSINNTTHFTPDGSCNNYIIVLTSACASAACTLDNWSTTRAGASGWIKIVQPSSGGPAAFGTYGSQLQSPGATSTITYSTAANAVDVWSYANLSTTLTAIVPGGLAFAH